MAANQQFCLRWNNHQRTLISVFDSLLESGTLVDCTLAAEGQYLKAHKVVLSACSPYLGVLLSQHHEKHPILILKDIKFQELKAMLDYMYRGEVNISQEQLCTFLKAAESLQIKGLTESAGLNPETKDFEERLVKRYDRKCPSTTQQQQQQQQIPNHSARTRSPPSNTMANSAESWNQKYASSGTNFRSNSPPSHRIRDGSLSPTARKRRKQQHPQPSVEDSGGTNMLSAAAIENHQDSSVDSHDAAINPVSSTNTASNSLTLNNIKTESNSTDKTITIDNDRCTDSSSTNSSNKLEPAVIPKTEPKFDDRHSDDVDAAYEDSVEEMTIEDEEEEIDENDLSRPGPSHSDDSQNYGSSSYQLSSVNDVSSGQLDCQEPVTDPLAEQRFVCRLCGKLYQWKQSLTRHIREDRCDKGPQHACPRCGIIFKHTTRLNRHILFCPSVQLNASESNAVVNVAETIISQSSLSQVYSAVSDPTMSSSSSPQPQQFISQTTTSS